MAYHRQVTAAIFDMDGLLIDSEPFWHQAELDVFAAAGVDIGLRNVLPDTTGLRIDQVVGLWFDAGNLTHLSAEAITAQIFRQVEHNIREHRPLMPGVREALELCRGCGLRIGLASASPLAMIESVLEMFSLREYFEVIRSAEHLPYSKPHPQVYLNAAHGLATDPLHCVALEDSRNGMVAATAARMRTLVVPAASDAQSPVWSLAHAQLNSLHELNAELLGCSDG